MVFSGQMNTITDSRYIRSTDCMHVALANLPFEIITVRDGVLSLPTWFSRDLVDDVLSSVCVQCWLLLFALFLLYVCLSCISCTIL